MTNIKVVDFCSQNKIPFFYTKINLDGSDKVKVKNAEEVGWKDWNYEKCSKFNLTNNHKNCVNIILKNSDYVVVDIDKKELIDKYLEKYGEVYLSYSCKRKMPHLWRKKNEDDKNKTNKLGFPEKGIDLCYHNVFELSNSEITKVVKDMPIHVDYPVSKEKNVDKKKKRIVPKLISNFKKIKPTEEELAIIDNIDLEYINNYDSWLRIIWSLYNSFNDIDLCINISKKSSKYKGEDDISYYLKTDTSKLLTFGTIAYYSKLSNPKKYEDIRTKFFLPKNEFADMELAETYIYLKEDNIINNLGTIYIYSNNFWTSNRSFIENDICKVLVKLFENKFEAVKNLSKYSKDDKYEFIEKLNNAEEGKDEIAKLTKQFTKKLGEKELLKKYIKSAKTGSRLEAIYKCLKRIILEQDYELDTLSPHLFCFRNTIFNLDTLNEEKPNKYDYITYHCGYDYYPSSEEDRNIVMKVLNSIFNCEELKQTWISIIRMGMYGKLIEKFCLFTGKGGNGKGLLQEFTKIMLGSYFQKGHIGLLTENQKSGGDPFLAVLDKKRFVIFEEPNDSDKLKFGNVKALTGGSEIQARALHSNNTKISLQCILSLECNKTPAIDGTIDDASVRRMVYLPFKNKFTDNLDDVDEEEGIFLADSRLKEKKFLDPLKWALFDIVFYSNHKSIYECEEVKRLALKYLKENDELYNFLEENLEKTENKEDFVKLKDLFEIFENSSFYNNLSKKDRREKYAKGKFCESIRTNIHYRTYFKKRLPTNKHTAMCLVKHRLTNILCENKFSDSEEED